ncbi:hypothetical protein [Mycobacterium sp. 29Ha]|uniref:hypothetical protein n=1 Tax=Mycobacterium sp. 29Ha TaxID=2939268 RepID=UPI0029391A8C|nr:hypothetical protein [Mycobacterium sp. 29Ha]MDV3135003.1 hypothetical protein [Mycobacterium sp. 29Ha]
MTLEEAQALDGKPTPILLIRPGMEPSGRHGVLYGLSHDKKQVLIKWIDHHHISCVPLDMLTQIIGPPDTIDSAVGYNLETRFVLPAEDTVAPPMRWYSRPEGDKLGLRVAPRLASWEKADHPDQVRLREYLADTEALLAASRVHGPWALRLDVGLPSGRDLLDMADLDNYAYPLANHLQDPGLVSVWCTKQHSEQSFVRIEPARETAPPSIDVLVARTTASASTVAYKEQIDATVAFASELPPGPVRLELAFVVGPGRNWLNLWKQTIDSLGPLLGRTYPWQPWHPLDGRITELGMHLTVDPAFRYEVVIGIAAAPALLPTLRLEGESIGLDEVFPPTPGVWAELAQHEMAGDHQFGKAVRFLEEGGTEGKLFAESLGIKVAYADWLLTHARKMKRGIIRVVVSAKNDGRETASIQAHHYRYVLDDDLSPETRQYVQAVIAKFRTVNPDIPMKAAKAQGAQDSYDREPKSEPALCTNAACEWAWTHHGGQCS